MRLQLAVELNMLKRAVTLDSMIKLIVALFSPKVVLITETTTVDHHGNIINWHQQATED